MISEKKNTKYGIMLSYGALVVSLIGTLFISNRVLNLIGDYNYGLYSFVNSITSWLTIVSSSLTASFLRYSSIEARDHNGEISRTNTIYLKLLSYLGMVILVVGGIVLLTLYKSRVSFGKYSWDDSKLIYLLFAFSIINIAITMPITIYHLYINYNRRFVYQKVLAIAITIFEFIGHFVIAYFTRSILFISAFSIFVTLLQFFCNYIYAKKNLDIKFCQVSLIENKTLVTSIAVFAGIMLLNSVVDQINSQVDKTLLGVFAKPEYVTLYQLGMQFTTYLSIFAVAISSVFAPKINELCVNNKKSEIDSLFIKVSKMQAIVVTFIAFGFIACGKEFVIWWIGESRIIVYYIGVILMVLNIMPLSVKVTIDIQRALNMHKFRSFLYFVVAIANVILSIMMLAIMPDEQAVFACLIGTVISNVICQWIAMNIYNAKKIKLPIKRHLLTLGKQMLFGFISVFGALGIKHSVLNNLNEPLLKFIAEGAVYVVIYGTLLFIFERKFIMDFIKK